MCKISMGMISVNHRAYHLFPEGEASLEWLKRDYVSRVPDSEFRKAHLP